MASHKGLRVAVVGAGIGGSATAHFVRSGDLGVDIAELVVFERGQRAGGRLDVVQVDDAGYEAGGSIIHGKNAYMVEFAKMLRLTRQSTPDNELGLFDGQQMFLKTSPWTLVTFARMLWRYGLDIFRLNKYTGALLEKFAKIYELQNNGKGFATPRELVAAMDADFPALLSRTLRENLKQEGFSERFIEELAMGIVHVNYGQTPAMPAFVGSVALAGSGAELWSVKGGNRLVAEGLLEAARPDRLLFGHSVDAVRRTAAGQYELEVRNLDASQDGVEGPFDLVFLACPAISNSREAQILFQGVPAPVLKPYQRTVATFVPGKMAPLGEPEGADAPGMVLVTSPSYFVNSIGSYGPVEAEKKVSEQVHKVFSKAILSSEGLESLFSELASDKVKICDWLAYPAYEEGEFNGTDGFSLDPDGHLYHVNRIEDVASAMEMSCIGAKNCVLLASSRLLPRAKL
ncbi:Prenylcysteine oxidase [Hondaea fermentalgiana]|uniref:Prenylcysteine oxidase n=1 Tax=Hondaea fermentalgiana TaxID=2315210 RepID=A0A2R5GAV8_9STRA|nr:Prenylcysteine oxidase [Hondaea fermentalgiana]|eukprot:GBG25683.1 Prenylcysteine oxidase [Hondaea fermentalgiana]